MSFREIYNFWSNPTEIWKNNPADLFFVIMLIAVCGLVCQSKKRLGRFIVSGTQEEILVKLEKALKEKGAIGIKCDSKRSKITIFGLFRLASSFLYKIDGNQIDFVVNSTEQGKVSIDVTSYCRCRKFRMFYTKDQWQQHGYDSSKVEELIQNLS